MGTARARLTPGLSQLIRELRAEAELIVAPPDLPLFIYRDGAMRAAPFSWKGLLRTDLFGARAKLRIMLEPFTRRGGDDESVGRYFRRRFGRDAYVHLLGPLFGGLYASDPDQMLARHSLDPLLAQMNAGRSLLLTALRRSAAAAGRIPACSFRNGMQTLTDAMHASLSDRVALNERVTAVRRAADGFVVETTVTARHCRHIVLTADAPASADLLAHLDHAAARRVRSLRYNRFAIVHLSAALALRGMGCQVSLAERFATRGVTFNASLFARDDVYTAFLGGANDPNFVDRDDAEIAEIARGEFRTITGGEAGVLCVSRATIPAWDRSWAALDDFRSPAGVFSVRTGSRAQASQAASHVRNRLPGSLPRRTDRRSWVAPRPGTRAAQPEGLRIAFVQRVPRVGAADALVQLDRTVLGHARLDEIGQHLGEARIVVRHRNAMEREPRLLRFLAQFVVEFGKRFRLLVHEADRHDDDALRLHRADHLLDVGLRPLDRRFVWFW
jgi:protoporphyrinogen/coproporphyrinogen III oxidase